MRKNITDKFTPEICPCCGMTTTYVLPITKGVVDIVRAFIVAVKIKGVNVLHPAKEMMVDAKEWSESRMLKEGVITPNMRANLIFARAHGLIAHYKYEAGNWLITKKGADFLRGQEVPKYAIVSKKDGHQIGYWFEEKYRTSMKDFKGVKDVDGAYWEVPNIQIVEGEVIDYPPTKAFRDLLTPKEAESIKQPEPEKPSQKTLDDMREALRDKGLNV